MSDINYLLKQAGLPPLPGVTTADITRALTEMQELAVVGKLDEGIFSTLKAILATVGQQGSKAGKAAADKATKLPSTIKALYKETETKDELRVLYKQFTVMLTTMDKMVTATKTIQEKDPEVKKELDLFTNLLRRTIDTLQARAGLSVAVKEGFLESELDSLLEQFLREELHQGLKDGQTVYHKSLKQEGKFLRYDDQRTENNDTCWVHIDGEDLHVSCDKLVSLEGQVNEAKYVSAAEFSDDFYSLLNALNTANASVNAKKAKLRNWLRRQDFANTTQADEMFDLFINKFNDAITALKSCDKHLQKKL